MKRSWTVPKTIQLQSTAKLSLEHPGRAARNLSPVETTWRGRLLWRIGFSLFWRFRSAYLSTNIHILTGRALVVLLRASGLVRTERAVVNRSHEG